MLVDTILMDPEWRVDRSYLGDNQDMVSPHTVLAALPSLANQRPVFHSEADLQHALAWEVQTAHPSLRVRLETRPLPGFHLDMLVSDPSDTTSVAVELKYLRGAWAGEVAGEEFALVDSAEDFSTYDTIKDVSRVERLVAEGKVASGLVLVISNAPRFWSSPAARTPRHHDAFLLHDGLIVSGNHVWGPDTPASTMGRDRTNPITLAGTYRLKWEDFSLLPGRRGQFRYLALIVEADHASHIPDGPNPHGPQEVPASAPGRPT